MTVAGGLTQTAALYGFDGATRLHAKGSAAPVAGALNLSLGARSATLAVVTLGTPTPPGSYSVFSKQVRSWSVPFQVWLPYASYFVGGIAFLATASRWVP